VVVAEAADRSASKEHISINRSFFSQCTWPTDSKNEHVYNSVAISSFKIGSKPKTKKSNDIGIIKQKSQVEKEKYAEHKRMKTSHFKFNTACIELIQSTTNVARRVRIADAGSPS
jgi:hypothetical protein